MRLIFAGTPDFAATILAGLINSHHHVTAVLTQPDRPAGRGLRLRLSPVKALALKHAMPVLQPASLRSPTLLAELAEQQSDAMVVAAYGLLLPDTVLALFGHGCINVHASLLPRWRGAAPIQRAILAGDTQSGISIMQMDQGLDTGPVVAMRPCAIAPEDTAGSLHDRLAALGTAALLDVLEHCERGELQATPQNESQVSYAKRIDKSEGLIDWSLPASQLERLVRAFNPWPIAYTVSEASHTRLCVWRAQARAGACRFPAGHIESASASGLDVATGDGVLTLLSVQPSGRNTMPVRDYLNAAHLEAGTRL